ncbi:hypothetical protein L2E82_40598 [Cichorium intybus]|uniref:Uncharacterized protein n=1 Tax=Cichorium intybus TaxID=13427 RepID=A0ACB9AKP1_CICIN|nr:hypothetical protein L2E82_40598 [Cichorium intybus]
MGRTLTMLATPKEMIVRGEQKLNNAHSKSGTAVKPTWTAGFNTRMFCFSNMNILRSLDSCPYTNKNKSISSDTARPPSKFKP